MGGVRTEVGEFPWQVRMVVVMMEMMMMMTMMMMMYSCRWRSCPTVPSSRGRVAEELWSGGSTS